MTFRHELLEQYDIEQVTNDDGRYYLRNGEKYTSVTTYLGDLLDTKKSIDKWKDRVGAQEANRISSQAAKRGTVVHELCENYLLNQESVDNVMPIHREAFSKIKPILDENVSVVRGIELPLFSKKYKLAGMTDLFCSWKSANCIVDFKTSRKPKKLEWITGYLFQSAIYGEMIEELYGIPVHGIVVIIAVDHNDIQVFKKPRKPIIEQFEEMRAKKEGV